VIVISTAHGLKFTEFKLQYHQSQLEGITSRLANLPIELPADYATVRDRVLREVERVAVP
jgi:threonine synthase